MNPASRMPQEEVETALQVCQYCRQLCEADMFSAEPIWSCAWCQAVAHVRCHQQFHPPPPKPDRKAGGRMVKLAKAAVPGGGEPAAAGAAAAGGQHDTLSGGGLASTADSEAAGGLATIADSEAAGGTPVDKPAAQLNGVARRGSAASPASGGSEPAGGSGGDDGGGSGAAAVSASATAAAGGGGSGGGDEAAERAASTAAAVSDSKIADAMGGLPPLVSGGSLQAKQLPPIRCVSNAEEVASEAGYERKLHVIYPWHCFYLLWSR